MSEESHSAEASYSPEQEVVKQLQSRNTGLIWLVVILSIVIIAGVGYFVWQQYFSLPLEITSVGVSYTEAQSIEGIGGNRFQAGETSTIVITARTKPGTTCEAYVQGHRLESKQADWAG